MIVPLLVTICIRPYSQLKEPLELYCHFWRNDVFLPDKTWSLESNSSLSKTFALASLESSEALIFGQKKILGLKFFLGKQKFGSNKNFVSKKKFGSEKICVSKYFGSQKNFVPKNKFWV